MNVTTQELVNRAAAAADMHDGFVTPAQAMYWASQEHLALSLFLARSGWTQNVLTSTITVTGSEAGAFTIPDPLAIVAVHLVVSGSYKRLRYNNYVDFLRQAPGGTLHRGNPREFRALWDETNDNVVLNFFPEPTAGTTLVVSYIPEPLRLTLASSPPAGYANSVKYPMGWEERIVLGMARRALAKEESDTGDIRAQILECEQRIEEACWNRALADSPSIRNLDDHTDRLTYPAATDWVFF